MKTGKRLGVTKKTPKKLNLAKWQGRCRETLRAIGYTSVDKLVEDMRER